MAIYTTHTAEGRVVAVVRADDEAPPPAAAEPGYMVSRLEMDEEQLHTVGEDAESAIKDDIAQIQDELSRTSG